MKLQKKIEYYLDQFETKKRGDEDIVVLKDNHDKALADSIHAAHGDRFPSDWIFEKYAEILSRLTEYDISSMDDVEEYRAEIIDSCVDCYTSNLTTWLNEHPENVYYLTEAMQNCANDANGVEVLSMAQYDAISEIFAEVVNLLTKEA